MTTTNPHNLVLCESADGWSLHAPGSTDDAIASGDAPYLACGSGSPTEADYRRAEQALRARRADNDAGHERIILPRSDDRDLAFDCALLGEGTTRDGDASRWVDVSIYRTAAWCRSTSAVTIASVSRPAASALNVGMMRCRSTGRATSQMSSVVTWHRLCKRARALPAKSRAILARGPAPYWTLSRSSVGSLPSSGRVIRARSMAAS